MPLTIQSRLRLHQSWIADLPLKFLWTVDFSPRVGSNMSSVGSSVEKIVNEYQPKSWIIDPNLFDKYTDNGQRLGYLLAQNVALPSEQLQLGTEPMANSGGFIAGYFADRRANYGGENKLDITFLETNKDIFDYFIKPWVVATSYKGLIEDDKDDIKCTIVVTLFSKSDAYYRDKFYSSYNASRPMVDFTPRKSYIFHDCVPFNVEGGAMSYGELDIGDLTKAVSFAFSYYEIYDRTAPPQSARVISGELIPVAILDT